MSEFAMIQAIPGQNCLSVFRFVTILSTANLDMLWRDDILDFTWSE